MTDIVASKLWLIDFYRQQLDKLRSIGLGNETEFGVVVTEKMIKVTEKRLGQLAINYKSRRLKA
tara:strand:+ start:163 stop:354 length:192 start_codon:yes stop_codon:yes gene_type:complete